MARRCAQIGVGDEEGEAVGEEEGVFIFESGRRRGKGSVPSSSPSSLQSGVSGLRVSGSG